MQGDTKGYVIGDQNVFSDIYNSWFGLIYYICPKFWKLRIAGETSDSGGHLEIFNMTGQLLEHIGEITNNEVGFDIKLSNGTYLLKFQSKDGDLFLRKFVVLN